MTLKEVETKCKHNIEQINVQHNLIGDLVKRVERNEGTIKNLLNKITRLETTIEIQKCYINVSERVSEELKIHFDNLAQEKEERLVVTGAKISENETPATLKGQISSQLNDVIKKQNINELNNLTSNIKSIHRIGRKKGLTQDLLLVFNTKSAKKDLYVNRKE